MKKANNLFVWLKYFLQLVMAAGLVLSIYQDNWFNVFLISLVIIFTLVPDILYKKYSVYIPPDIEIIAILFVFASGYLGEVRSYYEKFWWWDKVLHTSSGVLLGIVGFLLVYILNRLERVLMFMKPGFVAFFSFIFAVALGAIWEIFEFAMDKFFNLGMQTSPVQPGLDDTMWDLIVDTIGALFISVLGYFYMISGKESFFKELIFRFIKANPKIFKRKLK